MKKSILHFSLDVAGTAVATIANITIGDDGEYECEADIGRSSGRTRFTIGVFCEFYALLCFAVTRRALSLHLNLTSMNRTKRTTKWFSCGCDFRYCCKIKFCFYWHQCKNKFNYLIDGRTLAHSDGSSAAVRKICFIYLARTGVKCRYWSAVASYSHLCTKRQSTKI